MPKLTIEVTEKAHKVLKERAKSEERSLSQYLTLLLDDIANVRHLLTTTYTCTNSNSNSNSNSNDISVTTYPPKRTSLLNNSNERTNDINMWNTNNIWEDDDN